MIGSVAAFDTVSMNTALRRALMLGVSTLALGLSPAAWAQDVTGAGDAPANAQGAANTVGQDVPPQTGQTEAEAAGEEQDIVVTGLRASLQSAQAIKQNADQFVDSITAIDIGKLPDKNVAETLQRISGIQITRNRGEGSGIAIRGLTQVRTEVNGRDSFGGSGGRSLGFEDVPSELLSGVDVYKNPSAELIEGGIGGTVNLRTRMPFDQKDPTLFAVTMGANNYDLAGDTKFNASALLGKRWETGIGDIGVLVDVSYFGGAFRTDEVTVEPYVNATIDGQARRVPAGAGIGITRGTRERKGYYAAVQWAPNDDLEFYAQAFRSEYFIETPNVTSFVTRGTNAIGLSGTAPQPGFAFDNDGVFQSGGFSGFTPNWSAPLYSETQLNLANNTQVSYNDSSTTDFAGGFKWSVTDRLKFNVDLQYVKAKFENRSYTAFAQRDLASFAIDLREDDPLVSFGTINADGTPGSIIDPAGYRITALMDRREDSDADQKAIRADLEWEFDDGSFLRSITAGARATDRSAVNRATPYSWSGAVGTVGLTDPRMQAGPNPFAADFFHGNNNSVGAVPFVGQSALSQSAVGALFQSVVGRPLTEFGPLDVNTQAEQTYAGYVMLRFAAGPIDGNIGVRVINTKNEAQGSTRLTYRPDLSATGQQVTLDEAFDAEQNYTKVLPSLNVRAHITDTLQARFAAAKALARPSFGDLRAIRTLSVNYTQVTDPAGAVLGYLESGDPTTGSGGNPLLAPQESNQFDASLEWYPKAGSTLFGTVFYKDLTNFFATRVFEVAYPVPGQGTRPFRYSSLVNGEKGKVKGFEVGGSTFFDFLPGPLSGFGVQANLTYADSDAPGGGGTLVTGEQVSTPLEGLSKWSYNVIGMYEKYGFTARAAYNWRDNYLETTASNGTGGVPIYRQPYGQLDASISYDFSPQVSLTLDAVNLLRARQETYQNFETNPRVFRLEDRRIGLTFRIRN